MRLSTVMTALAAVVLAGGVAHADKEAARQHYQRGLAAYALGNYTEAASEYEKAFAEHTDSALLFNAAQAHRLAGNKKRALLLYENYLRLFPAEVVRRDEVQRHIDELKAAIAADEQAATSPPTTPVPLSGELGPPPQKAPAPAIAAQAPPPERPVYKRPWFWAVVGGAVVVVGVGVGLGVGLGTQQHDPMANLGKVVY